MSAASDGALYDAIGRSYATTRREDPRIAARIFDAIGDAETIVNVGAGTGNYEPPSSKVVAVDPSPAMLRQRRGGSPRAVLGVAEALPFPDWTFDAGLVVLSMHHWLDVDAGLRELARVSRRQVVFFFEPLHTHRFWALDYFPEALRLPSEQDAPGEAAISRSLRLREVRPVLVPHDCTDGFGAAFWARPEAYADPVVQQGMSWLALLPAEVRQRGAERLLADVASGEWDRRYGHLRSRSEYDGGYRVAVAGD